MLKIHDSDKYYSWFFLSINDEAEKFSETETWLNTEHFSDSGCLILFLMRDQY